MAVIGIDKAFVEVRKKIRQEAVTRMQKKMERAAGKIIARADSDRGFDNVTGNLYKSIAVGTYYKGELTSVHNTEGPDPTRPTLAKGETYNLGRYYNSPVSIKMTGKRPFKGLYGSGGQDGERAAEDMLLEMEGGGRNVSTWRLVVVAGVEYANFVEKVRGHNVISSLWQYASRYFRTM